MRKAVRGWSLSAKLTAAYSLLILVVAGALTFSLYWELRAAQRQAIRERLNDILGFAAPLVDGDFHALIRSPADETSEFYRVVAARLKAIQATSDGIVRIYTLRQEAGGRLVYVVDAAPPPRAQVGQAYPYASPALQTAGAALAAPWIELELYTDKTGTFLRGYAPLIDQFHQQDGLLAIELDAASVITSEARARQVALAAFLLTVPFGLLLVWGLGRRLTAPLADLAQGAERVARGQLEAGVPVRSRDEIGQLAETFNSMTRQLQSTLAALRRGEEHFRSVVENASDISLLVGGDGRIKYASPPVERILGYRPADLVGKNILDYVHPDDLPTVTLVAGQALDRPRAVLSVEFRLLCQAGAWRQVEAVGSNQLDNPAVAGVVVNLRDITERKRAEVVQAAIHKISEAALLAETVEQLSACIHDIIGELMPARNFYIALYDPDAEQLSFPYFADAYETSAPLPARLGRGLTEYVLRTGESQLVSPEVFERLEQAGEIELVGQRAVDWLGVPLQARDRTIGVLAVQSYTAGVRFNAPDQAMLEFVSTQVALALERKRAEEAHHNSERRLADIINYLPDAALVIDSRHRVIAWNRAMEELTKVKAPDILGAGDYAYALPFYGCRRPMLIDYALQQELDPQDKYRSLQIEGDVLIGEAQVTGLQKGESYIWGKAAPLYDTDGKIVGAIETVRDITERVLADREIRQRNRELDLLNRIVAAATSTLEPEKVLEITLRELAQGLDIPHAGAALLNEDHTGLTIVADYCLNPRPSLRGAVIPLAGNPATQYVLEQKAPLALADVQHDPRMAAVRDLARQEGFVSMLLLPLVVHGQGLGTVGLDTFERREFTAAEITLAANATAAAAQAIENARLFAETAESLEREQRLKEVARTISSTLNLSAVLQNISRLVTELVGAAGSALALLGPDGKTIERQYQYLFTVSQELTGADLLPRGKGRGLTAAILETGQPLLIEDYGAHPDAQQVWVERGVQGFIGVPVVAGEACLGVLGLFSMPAGRRFTKRDLALVESVGRQAGVAIQNARLFEATRQQARDLEGLLQLSSALRQAAAHEEMLPIILDQTLQMLNAEGAALALRDLASGEVVAGLGRGTWAHWTGVRLAPNEGLTAVMMETGEAYVNNDIAADARFARPHLLSGLSAVAGVPLIAHEYTVGVLGVGRQTAITESDVRLLRALADIAASAIHSTTLHEQTEQRLRRLIALRTIDLTITANQDLRVTLNILLEQTTAQLGVDAAAVLLFKPQTQSLAYAAGLGFRTAALKYTQVRLGEGFAGRAALQRRFIHVPNLAHAPEGLAHAPLWAAEGFVTYYGVPLLAKGQVKGVLEIFTRTALTADPEWVGFLESLAGQAAIAIDNATLFDDLQHSNIELALAYDTTLEGWSRALDLRDKETEGHTRRVTELTLRLAQALGASAAERIHIRRGALLHDIGKMGIPDNILLKASPLTDEEMTIMRRHPQYAYELLEPITYLAPALDIPYCHHEKWDGTGYPRGLQGEQIPLAARLFAVADVWDAVCSDRPYHRAWSREQALAYIREQAGKYFDPQVVEVFLRLLEEA